MADTLPVLSEHQAPEPERAVNFEPTPQERHLITKLNKLLSRWKNARNRYDPNWMDYYKFFRGRQWSEQRPSYRHSEVINIVFQTIQSQVPILTDARPKFEYIPEEPSDREFAELMNEITTSDWQSGNWLYKLTEVLYDGHIYGTGLSKLVWDQEKREGRGGICYTTEEIFYAYPDPDSENVNDKSGGFLRAEPMTLADIRKKWPKRGKFVTSDVDDLLGGTKADLTPLRFRDPTGQRSLIESSSAQRIHPMDEDKALVVEIYFHDHEIDEIEVKNEDGSVEFEQRLKYPKGRRVVYAGEVVLEDDHNPYDDGKWPWQRWVNYMLPREFWGESEVSQIMGPQKVFNKIFSFILDAMTMTGNPIWIIDHDTGIDPDKLTNAPGLVVEKNPGTEARREAGTQLQPYILQTLDRVKEYIDQVAGSQDITRGIPTGGVTAASAIADLQNAAQTRIRQKSRNIDAYLQDLGAQYASRVMQFYTAPRTFNYTGSDGVKRYFRAHIEQDPKTGNHIAKVQRFSEDGRPEPGMSEYELRGKLDVRVTTGTALASSKARLKEEQLALFDRGIIDREEFFKSTDYPNWEAVLDRIQEQEAQAAQAEAQSKAAAPA